MKNPTNVTTISDHNRRHDLDALRAVAMLLGIVLHAMMSFVPAAWMVQDSQAGSWATITVAAIHGFRMPLFFLISGFFTAMLWRNRGLKALITHRFKRIFLPLVIGMVTIVPAVWAVTIAVSTTAQTPGSEQLGESSSDASKFDASLGLPLLEAAMRGNADEVTSLLARGANVNATDDRGSTALHVANLFGHADVARLLIDAGANPTLVNSDRSRPIDVLNVPWGLTKFYADLLQVDLDRERVATGREEIAQLLNVTIEPHNSIRTGGGMDVAGFVWLLMYFPIFHHLWFLWFLCWLVAGFAIIVKVGSAMRVPTAPKWLFVSAWRYLWLIPITAVPQYFMTAFGPDTSIGLVPMPGVLIYYAIFFAFGALYYEAGDAGEGGDNWRFAVVFPLIVLFPAALYAYSLNGVVWHLTGAFCSAAYAWLLCFGMIGLFRKHVSIENRSFRYLADSSYWLYLVHIPLIIYLQYVVKDWTISAWLKLPLICFVTSGLLLLSYEWFVRYSAIGTLLNGPRRRPSKHSTASVQEG